MYRNDPFTMLTIARLHQEEIRASFPRRHRTWRPDPTPQPPMPPTGTIGAPPVPAEQHRTRAAA